ncbi:MAG: D-alanine--D-alanine ligase [Actinobacteria bacterium]|nr:D-alanine--D-alanine ligase [Actinomycetota bacterium]
MGDVGSAPAESASGERRIRVAVVFGGQSSEHEISCLSAASVMSVLDPTRYDVIPIGIDRGGMWSLQPVLAAGSQGKLPEVTAGGEEVLPVRSATAPTALLSAVDVVFPVLHGPFGEDGTIQGLLELAGVPYVGSGVLASAAAMNKAHCKALLSAHGVRVVPWFAFHHRQWLQAPGAIAGRAAELMWPVFVKPARAGSSVGISKVASGEQFATAVEQALQHDPHVLVEAAVLNAREIEVGVLTGSDGSAQASVPAEIVVREGHEFYDYEAKYLDDAADLIVPAALPSDVTADVRRLACEVFEILGCEGLARVDFFVLPDGSALVNEVNTMPGFTSISLFPQMWQASGVSYSMLVDHLVRWHLPMARDMTLQVVALLGYQLAQ